MSSYTYRKLEPFEFDLLIPLMKDSFGMEINIEYFRWKYLDNPAGPFIGFIAVEDGTGAIGAYYGVIPELYSFDGITRTIYQSCDTMTHSAHRRRGLFQKLAIQCYDYLRSQDELFVIGFGGSLSTPGLLKFGWTQAFRVRFYVYPKLLQPLAALRSVFGKSAGSVAAISDLDTDCRLTGAKQCICESFIRCVTVPVYSWRIANPLREHRVIAYQESPGRFTG